MSDDSVAPYSNLAHMNLFSRPQERMGRLQFNAFNALERERKAREEMTLQPTIAVSTGAETPPIYMPRDRDTAIDMAFPQKCEEQLLAKGYRLTNIFTGWSRDSCSFFYHVQPNVDHTMAANRIRDMLLTAGRKVLGPSNHADDKGHRMTIFSDIEQGVYSVQFDGKIQAYVMFGGEVPRPLGIRAPIFEFRRTRQNLELTKRITLEYSHLFNKESSSSSPVRYMTEGGIFPLELNEHAMYDIEKTVVDELKRHVREGLIKSICDQNGNSIGLSCTHDAIALLYNDDTRLQHIASKGYQVIGMDIQDQDTNPTFAFYIQPTLDHPYEPLVVQQLVQQSIDHALDKATVESNTQETPRHKSLDVHVDESTPMNIHIMQNGKVFTCDGISAPVFGIKHTSQGIETGIKVMNAYARLVTQKMQNDQIIIDGL